MHATALFRPTFTDLRSEVERRVTQGVPADEITALIDQFLASGGDLPAPIVEYDGTVTWLYRNANAEHVAVVGDIVGYDVHTTRMARIAGTDLFYMTAQLPIDAQIGYAFAVDNPPPEGDEAQAWEEWLGRCILDPLNPQRIAETNPLRMVSVLTMPSAQAALDLPEHDPDSIVYTAMHIVSSATIGVWRRIWVSIPLGYDPNLYYSTIYFVAGEGYLLAGRTPEIAAALVELQEIAPAVLVFLEDGAEHGIEWLGRLLADAVIPFIEARYAVRGSAPYRAICGASGAGAASLAVALSRPDLFGGAAAQSPSADLTSQAVAALLARAAGRNQAFPRFYIDVGRYEQAESIESVHALCATLIEGGASVAYQEFAGDHSFLGWRATLPDALRFHLGASPLDEL
ncbi:MAG: alpha/beta hydrolase-fold protein [Roseiflexaceae bacterium]|nr:alpha/beta hydrolase-fold protein [Roseiflexaceae bacterium]